MHNLDTTTDGRPDAAEPPDEARHDDDPGRRELMALHAERTAIEQRLARAEQERLYLADPAAAAAAQAAEETLLADLDRVMTRIRAAEYRSQPGARTW
ncbi:hypothetical protein [Methylobacterium platani]|nr:hypothetical protein [Methylobacterium platani]